MLALKIFLIFTETVCSLLLIGVILLQKAKGEGLGMAFGAEMGESIFGARASNVLVKITTWLGIIFLVNTLVLATIYTKSHGTLSGGRPPAPIEQPVMPSPGASLPPAPAMPPPASLPAQEAPSPAPVAP